MFTLYRHGDFHRKSSPEDYALVLSPNSALELATQYYDLNPRDHSMLGLREAPRRLSGNPTWTRASTGYADPVYDYVKQDLRIGWFIGIDLMGEWNPQKNPFYVDENGDLVCPQSYHYHAWFVQEIVNGYRDAVQARNGMKARPTQRLRNYGGAGEPEQHAQAGKTINSKAAGRLLAAGGIYNGNIEGFHETAQQLGGDAPAGYDQVMDNKGLLIIAASVAAGLTMGRVNVTGELEEISALSKTPKPLPSEMVNFEPRQLQKKFKHAIDFNVPGNPNTEGLKSFEQALKEHIDDPLTQQITGKYRWNQDVYHYYNPSTSIDVMTKMDDNFISGWKLSETQISDLIGSGNVF